MAILQDQKAILAQLEALKAENARLKAKAEARQTVSIKVHALGTKDKNGEDCKGNISVYGLGRFPVTLYASQWTKLLDKADELRQVIEVNLEDGNLATKD
jgi:hypothetical protein